MNLNMGSLKGLEKALQPDNCSLSTSVCICWAWYTYDIPVLIILPLPVWEAEVKEGRRIFFYFITAFDGRRVLITVVDMMQNIKRNISFLICGLHASAGYIWRHKELERLNKHSCPDQLSRVLRIWKYGAHYCTDSDNAASLVLQCISGLCHLPASVLCSV